MTTEPEIVELSCLPPSSISVQTFRWKNLALLEKMRSHILKLCDSLSFCGSHFPPRGHQRQIRKPLLSSCVLKMMSEGKAQRKASPRDEAFFETVTGRRIQHIKYKTTPRQPPVKVWWGFPNSQVRNPGVEVLALALVWPLLFLSSFLSKLEVFFLCLWITTQWAWWMSYKSYLKVVELQEACFFGFWLVNTNKAMFGF